MSVPYTPEQNGVSERENRTIMEAARSMMYATDLPKFLWAEAANTAVYVLNLTGPTSVEGKTPLDLWFRKEAKIDHLKVFGTECFIHIPKQKRHKLDKKAQKGYVVGYCVGVQGYRVWVPEQHDVVLSRDVKFKHERLNPTTTVLQNSVVESDVPSASVTDNEQLAEPELIGSVQGQQERQLRDRSQIKKPDRFRTQNEMAMLVYTEPENYEEAVKYPEWCRAMDDEMEALRANQTWELVEKPSNKDVISNRWVYRVKSSPDNSASR